MNRGAIDNSHLVLGVTLIRWALLASSALALLAHRWTPLMVGARPSDLYQPISLWWLLPDAPSGAATSVAYFAALVGWFLLAVRRRTDVGGLLLTLGLITVASARFAHEPSWSHGSNATCLALLAFVPWHLKRAWEVGHQDRADLGSLRTAQLLLAMMFLNAAWWKLTRTGFSWAAAENLRTIMHVRFTLLETPPSPMAWMILNSDVVAALAGPANLILQLAPAGCWPLLRNRWAQITAATAWTLEAIGLHFGMQLFAGQFLPLGLLFLATVPQRTETPRRPRTARAFQPRWVYCGALIVVAAGHGWLGWERVTRAYPFTAFTMFSVSYRFPQAKVRYTTDPPAPPAARAYANLFFSGPVNPDHPEARTIISRRMQLLKSDWNVRFRLRPERIQAEWVQWRNKDEAVVVHARRTLASQR